MYSKEGMKETQEASSRLQARKLIKESGGRYVMQHKLGEEREDEPLGRLDFDTEDSRLR